MDLLLIKPMFGQIAIKYAFKAATPEGKMTIYALAIVSMLSWTVIITKARQLWKARKVAKKFFAAYRSTRDPLDLLRNKQEFDGTPAYEVYLTGAEELSYHLKNNPVQFNGKPRITRPAFDFVRVAMERVVSAEGMGLEKGMIVLTTADEKSTPPKRNGRVIAQRCARLSGSIVKSPVQDHRAQRISLVCRRARHEQLFRPGRPCKAWLRHGVPRMMLWTAPYHRRLGAIE